MSLLVAGEDVVVAAAVDEAAGVARVAAEDFRLRRAAHIVRARALGRAQVVISRPPRVLRVVVPLLPLDLRVVELRPRKAAPGPAAVQHAQVRAQVSAPELEPALPIALREAVPLLGN
jgi:hypothetical protein